MTNLTDITNLTDSALDALLGVDAEAEAEAERAEHNRRSLAARVRPAGNRNTAAAARHMNPTDAMIEDWASRYED